MSTPIVIGISLGDPAGIGPEVTFKAIQAIGPGEGVRFVIYGEPRIAADVAALARFHIPREPDSVVNWVALGSIQASELVNEPVAAGGPIAARAAVAALRDGGCAAIAGNVDALVTAPVNKEAIVKAGIPFVGQTEFLAQLCGTKKFAMMLLGHDARNRWLRVALATTHIPLSRVPSALNPEVIADAIELADLACRLLDLPSRRVGVCGLNPHAGEGGTMGCEEASVVQPGIVLARSRGANASGPIPGDTIFYQALKGDYDAVVAMYHDQGLAPLKTVAFDTGINWTLGLPIIRTSPDHGTAYDIAGRDIANPSSMECAMRLAIRLARNKSMILMA
ncbi:MAG TPA: 4-hydroxythreonine-4-phosphate dehydrogenase PdxA [Candidatus Limnocylindria bacterium]|jgi:4-hydroxythreonine-4-phosphate dehydrogenase|nr:4-hydroxythreonine-4-phosphate dehydrogenase PdxA [Candidatus Limnocylindria bacterium]